MEKKYKGYSIVWMGSYWVVYYPGDLDCYQVPHYSIDAAKTFIDQGHEFMLAASRITNLKTEREKSHV